MTKRMTVQELRASLDDMLSAVSDTEEPVVIEKKGKPLAVLISPRQFERFEEQSSKRLAEIVENVRRRNHDKDPDEVYRDITAAVEEVRRQRDEQQKP